MHCLTLLSVHGGVNPLLQSIVHSWKWQLDLCSLHIMAYLWLPDMSLASDSKPKAYCLSFMLHRRACRKCFIYEINFLSLLLPKGALKYFYLLLSYVSYCLRKENPWCPLWRMRVSVLKWIINQFHLINVFLCVVVLDHQ